jgi:RNA polymerase II transcription initiation/nucleotide excision repair factor TFIIH, subunit SSL1
MSMCNTNTLGAFSALSGPYSGGGGYRRRRGGWGGGFPYPVVVETPASDCACHQSGAGSGFEQKIKENPVVFVVGALLAGYLLAKNR